jgi:hypothetical protein
LFTIDVSIPESPSVLGRVTVPNWAQDVAVSADHAFVASFEAGLQVVDTSNPTSPGLIGGVETPGSSYGIDVDGIYAYVADSGFGGLQIVDVSHPESPVILGGIDIPGAALDVEVESSYAYVAAYPSGLYVVNVSDPTSPSIAGSVETDDYTYAVAFSDTYAYITGGGPSTGSLCVIDVSDVGSPWIAGEVELPGTGYGVAAHPPYVLVAAGSGGGLMIVNVEDPASPWVVGGVDTPGVANGVAASGHLAYVADTYSNNGLRVVDFVVPESPVIVGSIDLPSSAAKVALEGSYAYVASEIAGLHVVECVAVDGSYVYIADEESGLQIASMQCDDHPVPILVSNLEATPEEAGIQVRWHVQNDAALEGFVISRADAWHPVDHEFRELNPDEPVPSTGPWVYLDRDVRPDHRYAYRLTALLPGEGSTSYGPVFAAAVGGPGLQFLSPSPHPTRGGVLLRFRVPTAGNVRLVVVDLAGRTVRRLSEESVNAGLNERFWDGRDDRGHPVGSGVYLVRLLWDGQSVSRRIVVVE